MRLPIVGLALVSLVSFAAPASAEEGALRIEAEAGSNTVVSGAPVMLEATFRNSGDSALEAHLPEHLGAVPFPRWVFEAENGERYIPHIAAFQSMWKRGLQGEIMRLNPGQTRSFAMRVGSVVRVKNEKTAGHGDGLPLPPGRFQVHCSYTKQDTRVPYGSSDMNMTREWKPYEGLWTGTAQAEPFELVVTPSAKPVLEIEAPEIVEMGARYPIRVVLTNQSPKRLVIDGAFEVTASRKAYGAGTARFTFHGGRFQPVGRTGAHAVYLDPAASIEGTIDLSAASFVEQRGKFFLDVGFYDLVGPGLFHLGVRFLDKAGNRVAETAMLRRALPLADGADSGLALRLESRSAAKAAPVVDVILENTGTQAIRVPAALAYPRNVFFSLLSETPEADGPVHRVTHGGSFERFSGDEPGRAAVLSSGLAWDGDAFEHSLPAGRLAFVLLQPGSEIRRRIALKDILVVDGGTLQGVYLLRAVYRNREPGRRTGIDGVFVGYVESTPLRIEGGAW